MAGTSASFNATKTRNEFRSVMRMGMPTDVAQQLTWRWRDIEGYVPDDPAGEPYDWTDAPVVDEPGNPTVPGGSLIVPYALEVLGSGATVDTAVGQLDFTRALVTLMEDDWEQVADADFCTCGNTRYTIEVQPPHVGLFDLTVVQVLIQAAGRAPA